MGNMLTNNLSPSDLEMACAVLLLLVVLPCLASWFICTWGWVRCLAVLCCCGRRGRFHAVVPMEEDPAVILDEGE
jgi:hypothetical protein